MTWKQISDDILFTFLTIYLIQEGFHLFVTSLQRDWDGHQWRMATFPVRFLKYRNCNTAQLRSDLTCSMFGVICKMWGKTVSPPSPHLSLHRALSATTALLKQFSSSFRSSRMPSSSPPSQRCSSSSNRGRRSAKQTSFTWLKTTLKTFDLSVQF